jgi:hypothetical protein
MWNLGWKEMSFANPESTEAKQYQSRYLVNWSIVVSALVIGVKIADFDVFWFCCFVRQKTCESGSRGQMLSTMTCW